MPFLKKYKFIQLLCLLLVLSYTNVNANTPTSQSWYVPNIITPVHLTGDTTVLTLSDFFIEPSKIDSLVFSKSYKGHWNKKDNTVQIITNSNMPPMAELKIWSEKKNTSILLIKPVANTTSNSTIKAPHLATLQSNKSSFTFSAENGITDIFVYWQNARIKANFTHATNQTIQVDIPEEALHKTRSFVRVFACNDAGGGNDLLVPLESGQIITDYKTLDRYDLHTLSVYTIQSDRFYNANLSGVSEKIKAGYFDSLHINTLSIACMSINHSDEGTGQDSVFKNIVSLQHRLHGNVLIDWESELVKANNFANADSSLLSVASYSINKFDVDGFEHSGILEDHLNYRALTLKLKKIEVQQHRPFYQFGGVAEKNKQNNRYVGNGFLDGQFDLNLYKTATASFTTNIGCQNLSEALKRSLSSYGSHHLMANVTGGYYLHRFNINTGNDSIYNKIANFIAFTATIPGIPILYYGDEIGLPDTTDPSYQPTMHFENLSAKESELKAKVSRLFQLRSQHMSLLYGDLNILQADETSLVYQRSYFTETTIVVFNNAAQSKSVTVKINPSLNGRLAAQFGNKFSQKGDTLTIQLPPKSFEIFIASAN